MLHKVKLEPLRTKEMSELSACEVVKTVAWRYVCSCGAKGRWRGSWGQARSDGRGHTLSH